MSEIPRVHAMAEYGTAVHDLDALYAAYCEKDGLAAQTSYRDDQRVSEAQQAWDTYNRAEQLARDAYRNGEENPLPDVRTAIDLMQLAQVWHGLHVRCAAEGWSDAEANRQEQNARRAYFERLARWEGYDALADDGDDAAIRWQLYRDEQLSIYTLTYGGIGA